MSLFVKQWVREQLPHEVSINVLEDDFRSGELLAQLLGRLRVVDEDGLEELSEQCSSGLPQREQWVRRWRQLRPHLRSLGVELTDNAMQQIMAGKPGAASALLLSVKCAVDDKRNNRLPKPPVQAFSRSKRTQQEYSPDPMLSHVLRGVDVENRASLRASLHLRKFAEHEFLTDEREKARTLELRAAAKQSRVDAYNHARDKQAQMRTTSQGLNLSRTQNWQGTMNSMRQSSLRDLQFEQTLQRKQDLNSQLRLQNSAHDAQQGIAWFELSMKRAGLGVADDDARLVPTYENYETYYRRITQRMENRASNKSAQMEEEAVARGIRERARENRAARLEKERRQRRMAVAQRKSAVDSPARTNNDEEDDERLGFPGRDVAPKRDEEAQQLERKRMQQEEKFLWAATVAEQRRAAAEENIRQFCEAVHMRSHDHDSGAEVPEPQAMLKRQVAERVARKQQRHTQLCREVVQDFMEFLMQVLPDSTNALPEHQENCVSLASGTLRHMSTTSYRAMKEQFVKTSTLPKTARLTDAKVVDVEASVIGQMLNAQYQASSHDNDEEQLSMEELLLQMSTMCGAITSQEQPTLSRFRLSDGCLATLKNSSINIAVCSRMDQSTASTVQFVAQVFSGAADIITAADLLFITLEVAQKIETMLDDFEMIRQTLRLEHTNGEVVDPAKHDSIVGNIEELAVLGNRLVCLERIHSSAGAATGLTKFESALSDVFMPAIASRYCKLRQDLHSLANCQLRALVLLGLPWNNIQLELFQLFQSRPDSVEQICSEVTQSAKAASKTKTSNNNNVNNGDDSRVVSVAAEEALTRDAQIRLDVLNAAGKVKLYKPKAKPKDKTKDKNAAAGKNDVDKITQDPQNNLCCVVVFEESGAAASHIDASAEQGITQSDAAAETEESKTTATEAVSEEREGVEASNTGQLADCLALSRGEELSDAQQAILSLLAQVINAEMTAKSWRSPEGDDESTASRLPTTCHVHIATTPSVANSGVAFMVQEILAVLETYVEVSRQDDDAEQNSQMSNCQNDQDALICTSRQALLDRMLPTERILHLHQTGARMFDPAAIKAATDKCNADLKGGAWNFGAHLVRMCVLAGEMQQMQDGSCWVHLLAELLSWAPSAEQSRDHIDARHQAWLHILDDRICMTEAQLSTLLGEVKHVVHEMIDQLLRWYRSSVKMVTACGAAWSAAGYMSNPFSDRSNLQRRVVRNQTTQRALAVRASCRRLEILPSQKSEDMFASFPQAVKRNEVPDSVYAAAFEIEMLQLQTCNKALQLCEFVQRLTDLAATITPALYAKGLAEIERRTVEAYSAMPMNSLSTTMTFAHGDGFVALGALKLTPKQVRHVANALRGVLEQPGSPRALNSSVLVDAITAAAASAAATLNAQFPKNWCNGQSVQAIFNAVAEHSCATNDLAHCVRRLVLHLVLACVPGVPSVYFLVSLAQLLVARKQQGTPRSQAMNISALLQLVKGRMWWTVDGGMDTTCPAVSTTLQLGVEDELALIEALALVSLDGKSGNVNVDAFITNLCCGVEMRLDGLLPGHAFHSGLYKAWCVQAAVQRARSASSDSSHNVAESTLTAIQQPEHGAVGPTLELAQLVALCNKLHVDSPAHELHDLIRELQGPTYGFAEAMASRLGDLLRSRVHTFSVQRTFAV